MSLAIYRKYRPAVFEDLVGQDLIVRILKGEASQDRISHAYLFAGPRGTGKTTASRLIAKAANCETRQTDKKFHALGEPCNKCRSCEEIDANHSLDVIEIDAASNRGIDEIRNLKETVRTPPSSSKFKVFIIDEAHQLTKDAANALLKTLEEPPEYAIFILATTEVEKIPATIASRTQRFQFKHIPVKLIIQKLTNIAKLEKISATSEVLELVAASAGGSLRDAESLLNQIIILGGDKNISVEEVENMVGKTSFRKVASFADLLLAGSREESLKALNDIAEHGYSLSFFVKDLLEHLRRVMVLKFNPHMASVLESQISSEHVALIAEASKKFETKHVKLVKELINCYGQMRYSQFPQLLIEVAIADGLETK